jgi:hypothetical protein
MNKSGDLFKLCKLDHNYLRRHELAFCWKVCYSTLANGQRAGDAAQPFRIDRRWRYCLVDVFERENRCELARNVKQLVILLLAIAILFCVPAHAQTLDCARFATSSGSRQIADCANAISMNSTGATLNVTTGFNTNVTDPNATQTWDTDAFSGTIKNIDWICGLNYTVSVNSTIPSNVHLIAGPTCQFSLNSGITLTINGPLDGSSASPHFLGSGTVLLNGALDKVPVQWFGAKGDGTTDDTAAIQATYNAVADKGGTVFFSRAGRYPITSTVNVQSPRPINTICDMFGQTWDSAIQGNGAILVGGGISGPMIQYAYPTNRNQAGGGIIEGCAFIDPSNHTRSVTAALELYDFISGHVSKNVFQYIDGSAIACEFCIMSQITGNVIRYSGDTSKPALYIASSNASFPTESLGVSANRLEVNYNAEYLKIGTNTTAVNIYDNRFEADTSTASSNGQFINDVANYINIYGNVFNRSTGTVVTIAGRSNSLNGNTFNNSNNYATIGIVVSGYVNTLSGNVFATTRTGWDIDLKGPDNAVTGNVFYSSGGIHVGAIANMITGNTMYQSTLLPATVGSTDAFWIDSAFQDTVITGNLLDNNGGTVTTAGGIRLAGGVETCTGNTVRAFAGPGNGAMGIRIEVANSTAVGNTLDNAPFSITNYAGNITSNMIAGAGTVPLYSSGMSYDPPNLAAVGKSGNTATTTVTVTGASVGDLVLPPQFSIERTGILWRAYVSGGDTVTVVVTNTTNRAVDLAAGTLTVSVKKSWN